jgi:hypothetical protein
VVPQGPAHVDSLVALVEDPKSSVPESAHFQLPTFEHRGCLPPLSRP